MQSQNNLAEGKVDSNLVEGSHGGQVFTDMVLVADQEPNTPSPSKRSLEPEVSPEKRGQPEWTRRLRQKSTVQLRVTQALLQDVEAAQQWYGTAEQGNPLQKTYSKDPVTECEFCHVQKHTTKWCIRLNGNGKRRATGSTCYSCYRASITLGLPRSVRILKDVPAAKRLLVLKSLEDRAIRKAQAVDDVCQCCECS